MHSLGNGYGNVDNDKIFDRAAAGVQSGMDRQRCTMKGNDVVETSSSSGDDEFLVSYRDRVYDIREFLRLHPGGRRTLNGLRNGNIDEALERNPHSRSAFHLFEEFALRKEAEMNDHEQLVDWARPILGQVGSLADRYWEWMNLPVNRPIRLFGDQVLESLTITPWYMVPIVWVPVCLYFLHMGYAGLPQTGTTGGLIFEAVVSYGFGFLLWTILEYVLHRKLFHFKPPDKSRLLITVHFVLHGVHHKAPFDGRRLLFPPAAGLLVAALIWQLYKVLFPQTMLPFIAAGTTTGYLFYDLTHYYLHHGAPRAGSYMYAMKRSHNYHHFLHHDKGFGISSKLWDLAFGTAIPLRVLSKPIEW